MDTELVIQAQRGDEEAFASLAVAVGDRLHAVAHRILRDLDLAEDATQQALLAIWRDLPQLRRGPRVLPSVPVAAGNRAAHWRRAVR
jgi:RNA polymerase sigma-70 factor (ECF subfamily)